VAVKRFFREDKAAEQYYDTAYQCKVEFDGGPLGRPFLIAQREFTPMRWAVKPGAITPTIQLIDDSGLGDVAVSYRSIQAPQSANVISYDDALLGVSVNFPGGLFVAKTPGHFASTVMVPSQSFTNFAQLSIATTVSPPRLDVVDLAASLDQMRLWESARLRGSSLAPVYRKRLLRSMFAECFGTIGGERWANLERAVLKTDLASPAALAEMKVLISTRPPERSCGANLAMVLGNLQAVPPEERVASFYQITRTYLSAMTTKYTSTEGRVECEFALRAASSPSALRNWDGLKVASSLRWLTEHPAVARAARFLVLAIDAALVEKVVDTGSIYAGWKWQ